jgi:hypothetical protein
MAQILAGRRDVDFVLHEQFQVSQGIIWLIDYNKG